MYQVLSIQSTEAADYSEPLTLEEAKEWANIDDSDNDILLSKMIAGARQDIEGLTGRVLAAKQVTVYYETTDSGVCVFLPYGSATLEEVVLLDSNDVETVQTLGTHYRLRPGAIIPSSAGAYKITYTAAPTVPQALKEAISMMVAYRYNNRGDQEKQQGIPEDISSRIQNYSLRWL